MKLFCEVFVNYTLVGVVWENGSKKFKYEVYSDNVKIIQMTNPVLMIAMIPQDDWGDLPNFIKERLKSKKEQDFGFVTDNIRIKLL